jgi:hypothetical protein
MNLRTVTNWRQIIKLPKFEYCSSKNLATMIPFFANRVQAYQTEFPDLPWDCPMEAKNYSANYTYNYLQNIEVTQTNVTQIVANKPKIMETVISELGFKTMVLDLPNGIYGNVINLTQKDDPQGFQFYFQFEWHKRLGDDKF